MKKVLIFIGVVVILFGALAFMNNVTNQKKIEGNPYGKDELAPETIKQLENSDYQNLILPDELEAALSNQENVVIYFYSPACPACVQATPTINQVAADMSVDVKQFNLLEFRDGFNDYNIESTPTLVIFEQGKEKTRLVGISEQYTQELETFFNEVN